MKFITETIKAEEFINKVVMVHESDVVAQVDGDDINRETVLSQSNMILVLLQVAVTEFGISCLDIVVSFI